MAFLDKFSGIGETISTKSKNVVQKAKEATETAGLNSQIGAIDGRLNDANLPECDVVIVALYPGAIVDYIRTHAHLFAEGARVFDCRVYTPAAFAKLL